MYRSGIPRIKIRRKVNHLYNRIWNYRKSDEYALLKNKDKLLSDDFLLDLPSHSVKKNSKVWNTYDWSKGGEEWVPEAELAKGLTRIQWKSKLINEIMIKHIKRNSTILEIGPGAGRWTETLQPLAKNLIIADVSQKSIEICKKRFLLKNNVEYKLIENRLDFIEDDVIDYIWSFAVFVHINPSDIERYIEDFSRILKPGGCAIIHHCGNYSDYNGVTSGWKTYVGKKQFAKLVEKHGLKIIEQTRKLQRPGDIVSVFMKPTNLDEEKS